MVCILLRVTERGREYLVLTVIVLTCLIVISEKKKRQRDYKDEWPKPRPGLRVSRLSTWDARRPSGLAVPTGEQEHCSRSTQAALGSRSDPCPSPAEHQKGSAHPWASPSPARLEAHYLPMGVPWRFPWLEPNSQAKVSQNSCEVALQQHILAFKVPVETSGQR